jgi:hypothetical protein
MNKSKIIYHDRTDSGDDDEPQQAKRDTPELDQYDEHEPD